MAGTSWMQIANDISKRLHTSYDSLAGRPFARRNGMMNTTKMTQHRTPFQGLITDAVRAMVIAALAGAAVLAAWRATAFDDFNAWTYDFTVLHAGLSRPSSYMVLVDFDEETFARMRQYPIRRSTIAETVQRIGAQKPRVIGMDIFLSEARDDVQDNAMQTALTSAGTVILASQDSVGILPPVRPLPLFCQPENQEAISGFCLEDKSGALGYAFVNLPVDMDGFVRQANLFVAGPPPSLSFPLMLAQQYTNQSIKPVDSNSASFNGHRFYYADHDLSTFLIGSWGYEPVPRIPAWRLLEGLVSSDAFTDKLVLIGQSNDAAHDRLFTPLFRSVDANGVRLRMSGTEVHGAAIRSLIEGSVVRPASKALSWGAVLGISWLAAFLLLELRPGAGVLIALALGIGACGVAILLYSRARFWLPFLPMQTGIGVALPLTLGLQFVQERGVSRKARAQRSQIMKLFSCYVDPAVAKTIWKRRDEVLLIGEERTATVMFTDIRSFTAMSAGKPPAEVLAWLNQYLTAMDEVIREHGGFLNKFIGDGLMIIFGLPLSHGAPQDARKALQAALAMLSRVDQLNQKNAGNPALPQLRIGVGIHTGSLVAGSIGSATRQEYSVIGSTVNLASRLESLNKQFHTEILMSQTTYDLLRDEFPDLCALGEAKVVGFETPVAVFTVAVSEIA
jgi:adenylate cyclase